jgi:hypothetical protein
MIPAGALGMERWNQTSYQKDCFEIIELLNYTTGDIICQGGNFPERGGLS